jgi:hypothetical protein
VVDAARADAAPPRDAASADAAAVDAARADAAPPRDAASADAAVVDATRDAAGPDAAADAAAPDASTGKDAAPDAACLPETCNGADDDCDGRIDEGDPGGGQGCGTVLMGPCQIGRTVCLGGRLDCQPSVQAIPEQCNGVDDDCDGQTDEGDPGGGAPCRTEGRGVCQLGTLACAGNVLACEPTNPPAPETCDGRDEDCDGQTDEGPIRDGEDVRLTDDDQITFVPSLAWSGAALGLAVSRAGPDNVLSMYFGRLAPDGRALGPTIQLSAEGATADDPAILSTGDRFFAGWEEQVSNHARVRVASIDAAGGQPVVGPALACPMNDDCTQAALDWTGAALGVAWRSMDHRAIHFTPVTADLEEGAAVTVSPVDADAYHPSLAWGGGVHGLAWSDASVGQNEIWFARLGADGVPLEPSHRISDGLGDSLEPQVVWNGTAGTFAIVWIDHRRGVGEVWFRQVRALDGFVLGFEQPLTPGGHDRDSVRLVWTGHDYIVVWRDRVEEDLYALHLSQDGLPVGDPVRLTDRRGASDYPAVAWMGQALGMAWADDADSPGIPAVYYLHGPIFCP